MHVYGRQASSRGRVEMAALEATCPCRKLHPSWASSLRTATSDYIGDEVRGGWVFAVISPNRWTGRISGASLGQGKMRPNLIVIASIGLEDSAQVVFPQNHDVIQALSTDRADQPLRMPILPG